MMKKLSDFMTVKIDVSNQTIFRVLGIALLFVVGVVLVMAAAQSLLIIFAAFFLAVALSPPVNYLADKIPWKSRGLATAIVFITVISIIGMLAASILPPVMRQTNQLIEQIPNYVEQVTEAEGAMGGFAEQLELEDRSDQLVEQGAGRLVGAGEPIFDFLRRVSTNVVAVLTVLVLTFFMLIEGPRWLDRFWRVQSEPKKERRQRLAMKMYRVVTGFVNGQLLIAAINALAIAIIMIILGVPFALSLAAIVGLLGLIPIIGATLGAIIVVIAGLFESITIAIILALYFIIYQQIENNVIQPAIQSRYLGMSPLLILISVVIGLNLAGILGALVAIPIAGCIQVVIQDYLDHHSKST